MKLSLQFFAAPMDYPDLNKCPDCETFFVDLNCPLCGKECPVEMRAGNRKVNKKKQRDDPYRRGGGRVQFVPWYYSAWFIIAMLIIFPIAGVALLWMCHWRKLWKILLTSLLVLAYVLPPVITTVFIYLQQHPSVPVDTRLSQQEYVERCEAPNAESLYRNTASMEGDYVRLEARIVSVWDNVKEYNSPYSRYYQCVVVENGQEWTFLVQDYRQKHQVNLLVGDSVVVYGQVLGNLSIRNASDEALQGPGIGMLYVGFNGQVTACAPVDSKSFAVLLCTKI